MRASGRSGTISRNTVNPPSPESNTRMVGDGAVTFASAGSRPDAQWRAELAERGEDRQRDDAAGFRILRGDILDRHPKPRGIGFDLDVMAIAGDGGIGPDIDLGAVRADAGER